MPSFVWCEPRIADAPRGADAAHSSSSSGSAAVHGHGGPRHRRGIAAGAASPRRAGGVGEEGHDEARARAQASQTSQGGREGK